jgi:hypothetical protein
MSFGGGFGGFGQTNNNQQQSAFGGFGSTQNTNAGRSPLLHLDIFITPGAFYRTAEV